MSGNLPVNPALVLPVSVQQFVENFPAFSESADYPESDINMYLTLGSQVLDPVRWGDYYLMGLQLYAGHFLTLDAMDNRAVAKGLLAGQSSGLISAKSLGGASITYDTSSSIEKDGGHWNLTTFGKRYLRMARMAGMGGVQIVGAGFDQAALGSRYSGQLGNPFAPVNNTQG